MATQYFLQLISRSEFNQKMGHIRANRNTQWMGEMCGVLPTSTVRGALPTEDVKNLQLLTSTFYLSVPDDVLLNKDFQSLSEDEVHDIPNNNTAKVLVVIVGEDNNGNNRNNETNRSKGNASAPTVPAPVPGSADTASTIPAAPVASNYYSSPYGGGQSGNHVGSFYTDQQQPPRTTIQSSLSWPNTSPATIKRTANYTARWLGVDVRVWEYGCTHRDKQLSHWQHWSQ
eukprot:TRINITY_DN51925_c0_g1_i1.p1 TRINITY_DN51925_c0_g1~~TRINITY_DN51925_c0_g1_i1.p1  ORF type:complete len:250 (+),score=19.13 TRINITY_DN51925_c0_g1_i1:64-750(+)